MQISFGTEASYNNRIKIKYKKEVKSIYITNSSFSLILSVKQDCMDMATNSQTSKCKVLDENGSIPLSITVCVHIGPYLSLFCATV